MSRVERQKEDASVEGISVMLWVRHNTGNSDGVGLVFRGWLEGHRLGSSQCLWVGWIGTRRLDHRVSALYGRENIAEALVSMVAGLPSQSWGRFGENCHG